MRSANFIKSFPRSEGETRSVSEQMKMLVECSRSVRLDVFVRLTSPGRLVRLLSSIIRLVDVYQATQCNIRQERTLADSDSIYSPSALPSEISAIFFPLVGLITGMVLPGDEIDERQDTAQ